jgi:hypothetical protein
MFKLFTHLFGLRSSTAESAKEKTPLADRRTLADLATISGDSTTHKLPTERSAPPASPCNGSTVVVFDETEIRSHLKTGERSTVKWSELREVGILTTAYGPFTDDLFWILVGDNSSCVVPSEAAGCDKLLSRLQSLPNFDHKLFGQWDQPVKPNFSAGDGVHNP